MIQLQSVSKVFSTGVAGLSDITLAVEKGEFVFLVGHTGSGKTTLLRLLVRDTLPTEGTIVVSDIDVVKLPASKIPHFRKKIGVVFQDLKLLTDRTIVENIVLPMQVSGTKLEEATKRAEELLDMVGLISHRDKFPIQLSGGELQRVAIARALSLSPEILLADEPTGNLDPTTAMDIVALLEKINETGTTIIMATHNLDIVNKLKKRVIALEKGKVVKDEKQHTGKEKVAKDVKESKGEKEKKDTKEKEAKDAKESHTPKVDEQEASESQADQPSEQSQASQIEEHKKETKRLSDLLAKARLTLHRKPGHTNGVEEEKKEALPFGFEKEADIREEKEVAESEK